MIALVQWKHPALDKWRHSDELELMSCSSIHDWHAPPPDPTLLLMHWSLHWSSLSIRSRTCREQVLPLSSLYGELEHGAKKQVRSNTQRPWHQGRSQGQPPHFRRLKGSGKQVLSPLFVTVGYPEMVVWAIQEERSKQVKSRDGRSSSNVVCEDCQCVQNMFA